MSRITVNLLFAFLNMAVYAQTPNYLAIDIRLGDVEKGERVISFVRLFPEGHEFAEGHEFPTASYLHISEVESLLHLDSLLGWNLYSTLYRHPSYPARDWQFSPFSESPTEIIRSLKAVQGPYPPPIAGLKLLAFVDLNPVVLIFDFRGVSLQSRNMSRAVSGGLDISRSEFDSLINRAIHNAELPSAILLWQ